MSKTAEERKAAKQRARELAAKNARPMSPGYAKAAREGAKHLAEHVLREMRRRGQ